LLHLSPNYQCSLHYHERKHETFTAIEGTVWVEYYPDYDASVTLNTPRGKKVREERGQGVVTILRGWAYDTLVVPTGMPHRFWTTDPEGAVLAEFSTPHRDSDVVRLQESRPLTKELADSIELNSPRDLTPLDE
jgi:mannose-6-phosphate isomerase-like protein (cupin superfamily)